MVCVCFLFVSVVGTVAGYFQEGVAQWALFMGLRAPPPGDLKPPEILRH